MQAVVFPFLAGKFGHPLLQIVRSVRDVAVVVVVVVGGGRFGESLFGELRSESL